MNLLRIATRKSPLALWQAEHVSGLLKEQYPDTTIELVPVVTEGDRRLDVPLAAFGGKGLFLKELEQCLLDDRADIAVHSMKDVPAHLPEGLDIACVIARGDPGDALVSDHYASLDELPQGAVVGTSSTRRKAQLLRYRPDLEIATLRGNLATRLSKLDRGDYQAIVLATSGLERLGMQQRIRQTIDQDIILPAIGQGIIGIECVKQQSDCRKMMAAINHMPSWLCLLAERSCGARLEADCHMPIAVHAWLVDGQLHLRAMVSSDDGTTVLYEDACGSFVDAVDLGNQLADALLTRGAASILGQ